MEEGCWITAATVSAADSITASIRVVISRIPAISLKFERLI